MIKVVDFFDISYQNTMDVAYSQLQIIYKQLELSYYNFKGSRHAPKSFVGPVPPSIVPAIPKLSKGIMDAPLKGWRDIYVEQGPEAWDKAVRGHKGN